MLTLDSQGHLKSPQIFAGMIISFYGTSVPSGWFLCDGTNNTPDLRGAFIVGDTAVGTGTANGSASAELAHAGLALANHSNHVVTQPSGHSAHGVTQPGNHDLHTIQLGHFHNAHTETVKIVGVAGDLVAPGTHAAAGDHEHNSHSAHSGLAVDAHSAHTGTAVDAHSVHAITQPTSHNLLRYLLVLIMKA